MKGEVKVKLILDRVYIRISSMFFIRDQLVSQAPSVPDPAPRTRTPNELCINVRGDAKARNPHISATTRGTCSSPPSVEPPSSDVLCEAALASLSSLKGRSFLAVRDMGPATIGSVGNLDLIRRRLDAFFQYDDTVEAPARCEE